jgi:hypothetical protein
MSKCRNRSAYILTAIVEKLLPWYKVEFLRVSECFCEVEIRNLVLLFNSNASEDGPGSKFFVTFLESFCDHTTDQEAEQFADRIEAIMNVGKRDDAGNITTSSPLNTTIPPENYNVSFTDGE